jgi:predicted Fe-Mo cluster-binding NifX family protein
VVELLSDCEAIITAQIGPAASDYVIRHGLRVFEGSGTVDDILNELLKQKLLDSVDDEEAS